MTYPPSMPKLMKDHMPKRNKSMSSMRGKMTKASNKSKKKKTDSDYDMD